MELIVIFIVLKVNGIRKLKKLKTSNKGNQALCFAIDKLINDLKLGNWPNFLQLKENRVDADEVHVDGFVFFNLSKAHRTLVGIFYCDGEADVVWAGNHDDYERKFKNNKKTIEKWLRQQGHIQ